MPKEPYFQLSAKFWRVTLAISFVAGFLLGYWDEVKLIWNWLIAFVLIFIQQSTFLPLTTDVFWAIVLLALNIAIVIGGYLLSLFWISQFALPVRSSQDRSNVFKRLFSYNFPFIGSHGPAIFVKEGKPISDADELDGTQPGVAFVDMYSSIVLEQQWGNTEVNTVKLKTENASKTSTKTRRSTTKILTAIAPRLKLRKKDKNEPIVRACGPGLVFTAGGEKIVGCADLRKQFRIRTNICCNTADGLEVKTNVFALFTLGQPPDIHNVAKINEKWMVVKFENATASNTSIENSLPPSRLIKSFSDELEDEDKKEIDAFFDLGGFVWTIGSFENTKSENGSSSPFIFDEERVIAAIYSRARDAKEGKIGEWTDLPVYVAVEILRDKLAHESYDELYMLKDPNKYPMKAFKSAFGQAVKNMGVLGYQVVRRKDGHPLEVGQICKDGELVFSPAQHFKRPAVLRERGIKILMAGFSELIPTNNVVRIHLFDNWRARWQQETEKTMADHDLQAMRIRNRERARAQQDMIYSLSNILQTDQYTTEALAMRLYQALEAAATQPATQRLLPRETIFMLRNLRQWLLPEEPDHDDHVDGFIDGEEGFLGE